MVHDVDYSNFEVSVAEHQGSRRASVDSDVWRAATQLQRPESPTFRVSMSAAGAVACGGVLIDDEGRILLREPTRHFDGFVWTFPSALRREEETEEAAAVRAALEDAGYPARIVERLKVSRGGGGDDAFFTMQATGPPVPFRFERTQALRWVEPAEAKKLIQQTTNAEGRARDLAVLAAALAASAKSATEPGGGPPM
jgi:8-oxo-dGTP diphosphatase